MVSRQRYDNNERLNGSKAYTSDELFRDLHRSIWVDLNGGKRPDSYRRALQKSYVEALIGLLGKDKGGASSILALMSGNSNVPSDAPAIARAQLADLKRKLTNAATACSGITRSHYQELIALIDEAFDNRK